MPLQGGTKKTKNRVAIFSFFAIFVIFIFSIYNHMTNYGAVATFRPAIRGIESGIVSYKTLNYNQIESNNFILKYENVDNEILDLIIYTAESKYKRLVETFDHKFDEKIEIIVYNDVETMMRTTMLRGERAPMGVYFGNSIHIYNPIYWVNENEDIQRVFYSEGPVLHELAHKFTDHLGRGNFPTWFTEGVSLYFEYVVDNYEWGLNIEIDEDLYSLENLTNNFYSLDVHNSYTQSFRLVREYVNRNGEEALIELIEELGNGKKINLRDFKFN